MGIFIRVNGKDVDSVQVSKILLLITPDGRVRAGIIDLIIVDPLPPHSFTDLQAGHIV